MEEYCVYYKTALMLKEKNFYEECIGYWTDNWGGEIKLMAPIIDFPERNCVNDSFSSTSAPMYQQVIDWAFKSHGKKLNYYPGDKNKTNLEMLAWLKTL